MFTFFQVNTPGILSCTEFRTFWAAWNKGHIQLGIGATVDKEAPVLEWQDPSETPKQIQQLYLETGDDAEGRFQVLNQDGQYCT